MINRRNFLGLGLGALAVSMAPTTLSAVNFRETKPKAFTATKVDVAIKELFGTSTTVEGGSLELKAPDIAENGAVIPVTVTAKSGSKVAIFQDANPEATVAVFTVPEGGIIDYSIRIKMAKTGKVTAVVEDGGKLYSSSKDVKVTIGGCGG
ncbi:thiosulfate oxidation carrier protein SoxY [Halarcobacter sp.]|uniref:thiosulfate oxidation carrier protein SoxY n=1 Tax=Halarcobacter sp. TaxID=2321133 RepID=UPI002AA68D1B|nr:thiosulfate oxidation carrier protein SoxY [Halarcobacter sp.]